MSLPAVITERLRAQYGLDPATLGEGTLRAAWQRARTANGAESNIAFETQLLRSPAKFDALVEELVVPESWFFRDGAPFAFLESWVRDEWRATTGPSRFLRILSVPCAAGQEPYSIAMTLLDAGLQPGQFQVQAGDVSVRALELAREAVYTGLAFRGQELARRDHHFEKEARNRFRVRGEVCACVQFRRCNLVDPDFFRDAPPFDAVFCRNVLIYFDAAARQRALANLRRCLAPAGLFFSGHADSLPMLDAGFVAAGPPGAFAYKFRPEPASSGTRSPLARRRTGRTRAPLRVTAPGLPVPAPAAKKSAAPFSPAANRVVADPLLSDARRLADAGVLAESESLCRDFLQKRGPHPEAFLLLGQLAAARGQVREAENLYRKAVYLDEKHPEALAHLALLAERRGDRAAATRLRQRART